MRARALNHHTDTTYHHRDRVSSSRIGVAGGGGSGAACALRNSGSAPAWQALLGRVGAWEECPDVEEAAPAAGAATDQVDAQSRTREADPRTGRTDRGWAD